MTSVAKILTNTPLDRSDIKALLKHAIGFTDADLISKQDYILTSKEIIHFNHLVEKRIKGVPVHYLLGYKEFYSREFKVNQFTLIPRPETELLVDRVLLLAKPNEKVLDLGTGCGCIAITCNLENPSLNIFAIDQDINTVTVAKENAKNLNADVQIFTSDWYCNINEQFNIIVSNPPYITQDDPHLNNLKYEPIKALTDFHDGLDDIKIIIEGSVDYLLPNGYLLVEHGYNQGERVRQLFADNSFVEVHTIQDYAKLDRITFGKLL